MSKPVEHSAIDVGYVAHLARLHLSAEEKARFQGQLENIIHYVRRLEELDVSGVEPTTHAVPVHNVLREDTPVPSMDHDLAMSNAPDSKQDQFLVPRILE